MEDKIKTHCNSCDRETNHQILFQKKIDAERIDLSSKKFLLVNCREEYCTIECLGCDSISFLVIQQFPDQPPRYENYPETEYENYDSVLGSLTDQDIHDLPKVIRSLYTEVEEAIDNYSLVLSGIGLRTLVEAICIDQKISGKNLQDKIKKLHHQGFISKTEEPILDKLRLIGNVSAHEIQSLSINKLEYAFGIINHILRSIYVLPKADKRLTLEPKTRKKIRLPKTKTVSTPSPV